jgi:hypothetical protein
MWNMSIQDPLVWVVLALVVGLVLALVVYGQQKGSPRPVRLSAWPTPSLAEVLTAGVATARVGERRRAVRRTGLPTPIHIIDPTVKKKRWGKRGPTDGYILDRSSGGLRLALQKAPVVGSSFLARPSNAPDDFPWVTVIAKSCREVGDYYEVGCQFESEMELGRLLMFG